MYSTGFLIEILVYAGFLAVVVFILLIVLPLDSSDGFEPYNRRRCIEICGTDTPAYKPSPTGYESQCLCIIKEASQIGFGGK